VAQLLTNHLSTSTAHCQYIDIPDNTKLKRKSFDSMPMHNSFNLKVPNMSEKCKRKEVKVVGTSVFLLVQDNTTTTFAMKTVIQKRLKPTNDIFGNIELIAVQYVLVYVDNLLVISYDPYIVMKHLQQRYTIKPDSIKLLDKYFSAKNTTLHLSKYK